MSYTFVNEKNNDNKSFDTTCKPNSSVYEELKEAIERRDVDKVSQILNNGDDLTTAEQGDARTLAFAAFKDVHNNLDLQPLIIQTLKLLFDKGVDVNAKDSKECTVLHLAVENRMTKVIDSLLDCQADLHVRDSSGNTLLHFLIGAEIRRCSEWDPTLKPPGSLQPRQRKSTEFIRWMILKGLNVDCQNDDGDTALHLAAAYNLLHAMPVLLKHAKDVKICNNFKKNAFLIFFEAQIGKKANHDRKTSRIVQNDDDILVNEISKDNYHSAFVEKIFYRFLNKRYLISFADSYGNTPVHYALKLDRPNIARSILSKYSSLDARDEDGNTALHIVIRYLCKDKQLKHVGSTKFYSLQSKFQELAHVLLSKGASINVTNKRRFSPLNTVMKSKNFFVQKMFIECAISFNPRYKENLLLYFFKTKIEKNMKSDKEVFDLLINEGWEVNAKDAQGITLLHVAAQIYQKDLIPTLQLNVTPASSDIGEDIVEALIKCGAQVDTMDNNGFLPLHAAIVHGNSDVLKKLLRFGADVSDVTRVLNVDILKDNVEKVGDPVLTISGFLFLIQEPISNVLKWHMIKLQIAKLTIKDEQKFLLQVDPTRVRLYKLCLAELESLKNYKITDKSSLYDLLHCNRNSTCAYVKNEKLKQLITSSVFEKEYPMYHTLISAAYYVGVGRRKMFESAKDSLNKFAKIRLPDVCSHEILLYLNNVSLRSMIEAAVNWR